MARAAVASRATVPIMQNFILRSEQFDNAAWAKRGVCTITANQVANPVNGAIDADLISGLGVNGIDDMYNGAYTTVLGTPNMRYVPSIWIKRVSTSGTVNISHPTHGASGGSININLATLGADWVRIEEGVTGVTVVTNFKLATTGVHGSGGMLLCATAGMPLSFYLWGAQVTVANWAGPYVQTVASAVNTGNIRNKRVSPRTIAQGQNLLLYSNAYDTVASWSNTNLTVGANTSDTTDYLGTNTADKVTDTVDGGSVPHYMSQTVTTTGVLANGQACVRSVIAKKGTKNYVVLVNNDGSVKGCFNLDTGAVGTVAGGTADITSLGGGWYLCNLYTTWNDALPLYGILMATVDNQLSYTGDGTGAIYLGNTQLVAANRLGNYGVITAGTATTTPIRNAV